MKRKPPAMPKPYPINERNRCSLGRRQANGHKGTFGTVCVVGGCASGSRRYIGAPALAALGALRGGCGLCRVCVPEPIINTVLGLVPSATGVALPVNKQGELADPLRVLEPEFVFGRSHVVVVGPGLGEGTGVRALVRRIWRDDGPVAVIDADGLNALAAEPALKATRNYGLIITPHPGEARRLMKVLGMEGDPTSERERPVIAAELARRLNCVVVLKGQRTVVSDGDMTGINTTGGPWLGTGGTGDVLAGVIAGFVAQAEAGGGGRIDLMQLASLAVYVHGRAGDAWAREKKATGGMLAAELTERVAREVERVRTK